MKQNALDGSNSCSILDVFGLPTDIVYSYCQPWDPITRLFSRYDPLYPLIDDRGEISSAFIINNSDHLLSFNVISTLTETQLNFDLCLHLGEDGYTPWVSGPTRTLRPILKTILESWEGW